MRFSKNGDDPTVRYRRSPDRMLRDAQEVIRRHGAGEAIRSIARELRMSRTSVARIVAEYHAARNAVDRGDDEYSE